MGIYQDAKHEGRWWIPVIRELTEASNHTHWKRLFAKLTTRCFFEFQNSHILSSKCSIRVWTIPFRSWQDDQDHALAGVPEIVSEVSIRAGSVLDAELCGLRWAIYWSNLCIWQTVGHRSRMAVSDRCEWGIINRGQLTGGSEPNLEHSVWWRTHPY